MLLGRLWCVVICMIELSRVIVSMKIVFTISIKYGNIIYI